MESIETLAELLRTRNAVEQQITAITGRPALIGHIGEFIAAQIFDIALQESASFKSIDGYFQSGELAGKSVNIKWYAQQQGILDITPAALPDYYLVLAGPRAPAGTSRGKTQPWLIASVYLFDAVRLVAVLQQQGGKIGIATSVRRSFWEAAESYPQQQNEELVLSDYQRYQLSLFEK